MCLSVSVSVNDMANTVHIKHIQGGPKSKPLYTKKSCQIVVAGWRSCLNFESATAYIDTIPERD